MATGYLVLASARRVLNVVLGDDTDAIRHTIGCRSIEHGTTLANEDQLIIDGDELMVSQTTGSGWPACRSRSVATQSLLGLIR